MRQTPIETLIAARTVADFAASEGVFLARQQTRGCYNHLGAALADAVLQAGLRYDTVVRPRIERILVEYPEATSIDILTEIVSSGKSSQFLNWQHNEKISRFESVVYSMHSLGIVGIEDLRTKLRKDSFCRHLCSIRGVGPKTVDYMACLVGIDAIPIDRHIRSFAQQAGLRSKNYDDLKKIFCFAADLLSMPRRSFDSWIWKRQSERNFQT